MSILLTPDTPPTVHDEPAPIAVPAIRPLRRRFAIAVVSYGLPGVRRRHTGVDQVAHDLANALTDRGHSVTVFSYDAAPPTARYRTRRLPLGGFATSWPGRQVTVGFLGNLFAVFPDYREFDLIMANADSVLLPLAGKPLIRLMHGSAREEARSEASVARKTRKYGVYMQDLFSARTQPATVAVSANTQQSNPRIQHVIPNGVDLTVFRPDPSARSARPSLLFVGSLHGRKRGAWLLERFRSSIRTAYPDAELHMVCAPGQPEPGVHFHDAVGPADLVKLYQQAWVHVSTSTYEAFGLTYLEAMACGTPVVASPNPGSREVLADGRYGVIADDEQFAAAVVNLLAHAETRQEMTTKGLQRARSYDVAGTAHAYEALMQELVAS